MIGCIGPHVDTIHHVCCQYLSFFLHGDVQCQCPSSRIWPNPSSYLLAIQASVYSLSAPPTAWPDEGFWSSIMCKKCFRRNINVCITHFAFDTLYWVNNNCNSSFRQSLKALLCIDVDAWQPAAEAGMRVIPADDHLRSTINHKLHHSKPSVTDLPWRLQYITQPHWSM